VNRNYLIGGNIPYLFLEFKSKTGEDTLARVSQNTESCLFKET